MSENLTVLSAAAVDSRLEFLEQTPLRYTLLLGRAFPKLKQFTVAFWIQVRKVYFIIYLDKLPVYLEILRKKQIFFRNIENLQRLNQHFNILFVESRPEVIKLFHAQLS